MDEITKKATPFLAKFKSDKNAERIVLITDNSYNLFKGIYITGKSKGVYSEGINFQFLELYNGDVTLNNEILSQINK